VDVTSAKYSAAASAAGYLFQARLALAEALRFAYSDSGIEIAIEKLDDVSFEADGEPVELLQTKHHVTKVGDLTDFSPDLWKTLRIWSDKVKADPSLPSRVRFTLVTTATAPDHSAAGLLRPSLEGAVRDTESALARLAKASAHSQNEVLKPAFQAFNSLVPEMQRSLLDAIDVLDCSPNLQDLEKVIDSRLKMIAPRGKTVAAREQIEGWWWGRLAKALQMQGSLIIARLRAELAELEKILDDDAMESRLDTALNLVGQELTRYSGELALEHGENPLRLDRKQLTVVADTVDGPLSLAQIGSGENWVGYHVAAHLALHSLFRRRKRPVPAFMMFDQPSQAHYPPEHDQDGKTSGLPDEDQAAVHKLFRVLYDYCQSLKPNMQVIVSDHVELLDSWFRDSTVQRWRDGIALVPANWPERSS
jgi:hypothetical protein